MTPTWQFIYQHADADVLRLALQAKQYPNVDIAFALRQIAGRQKAKHKIPTLYKHPLTQYPDNLPLEQCSSEKTARYKATLVSGKHLTDLTGGFGIDTFFMSEKFALTDYVEQNKELCAIATANFRLFNKNICTHNADCVRFLKDMQPCDCIFIDPARRDNKGQKTVLLPDCTPDLTQLYEPLLQKASTVWVKLSPMLDVSATVKQIPRICAIHIVAVENECKEILLLLKRAQTPEQIPITTVNITKTNTQTFTFTKAEETNSSVDIAQQIGDYLYEPNAAVLKAGAFKRVGAHFGLQKLHTNTHLYTSNTLHSDFCGRTFKVECVYSLQKQALKTLTTQVTRANIAVRNFPSTAEQLRKKLHLQDGGDIYLFGTTQANGQHILVQCKKA